MLIFGDTIVVLSIYLEARTEFFRKVLPAGTLAHDLLLLLGAAQVFRRLFRDAER